jgi:hypothetical protein
LPKQPWIYRLTDEGIEITSPAGRDQRPWTTVLKVTHTDKLIVLRMIPSSFVGVPRAALTDGDPRDLNDLLVGKNLRQAWSRRVAVPC